MMLSRVLIVAGSDSGGGAGIQADIKTVTALGGYSATAITALTAQNSLGVSGIEAVPPAFIASQMQAVLSDIGADVIKTGMLGDGDAIGAVVDVLDQDAANIPLVVDPVMVAKGGATLLGEDAKSVLKEMLLPRAFLVTPNLPEAEALLGCKINGIDAMEDAAHAILALGPKAVLLKGGHLPGDEIVDVLVKNDGVTRFDGKRINTPHTHGTGCTLASAIATSLAQGMELIPAVSRARAYVLKAIATAPGLGSGHGPLNHGHGITPFQAD
jgi:hydroxymethylpyrimidine/phosphomethylpyrimidine kinase